VPEYVFRTGRKECQKGSYGSKFHHAYELWRIPNQERQLKSVLRVAEKRRKDLRKLHSNRNKRVCRLNQKYRDSKKGEKKAKALYQ